MNRPVHRPTERVLDILEVLSASSQGLTLTELATLTGTPKSTITPIVHTLADRNFIFLDKSTSLYTIGISAFSVGSSYSSSMDALQFIQREMKYITSRTSEICQLGIRDHNMVLYLAKEDSPEPIRLVSYIGKRLPLYCTALGKALILSYSIAELKALYPEGLKAYTPSTITSFSSLEENLARARGLGYTEEHTEISDYINCLAVPLCKNGQTIAAISVSIPSFRFTEKKKSLSIQTLKTVQKNIENFLVKQDVDVNSLLLHQ